MMIDSYESFKLWRASHLHFTDAKFSIVKYGSRTAHVDTMYKKLTSMELKKFSTYGKQFDQKKDYCQGMIAAYLDNINPRYDPIVDVMESYKKFLGRKQSLTYVLKTDLQKLEDSGFSGQQLMAMWIRNEVSPEFIILIDSIDKFLDTCYNNIVYIGQKQQIFTLLKYKELINTETHHEKIFGKNSEPNIRLNW